MSRTQLIEFGPPVGARVVFTDRHGGVSQAPYDAGQPRRPRRRRPRRGRREPRPRRGAAPGRARLRPRGSGSARCTAPTWCAVDAPLGARARRRRRRSPRPSGLPLAVLTADCAPIALVGDGAVGGRPRRLAGLEAGRDRARRSPRSARSRPARSAPCSGRASTPRATSSAPISSTGSSPASAPTVAARTADGQPALDVPAAVRVALAPRRRRRRSTTSTCAPPTSPDHFSYRRDGVTGRQAMVVVRA